MFQIILNNGVKANIWIDEEPIVNSCECSKLILEEKAKLYADSRKLIVELFIPRAHSNYALLGVDFLASENNKVVVKLGINNFNNKKFKNSLALSCDTVFLGIMDEFEEGIIHSIDKHMQEQSLPSGVINYNIFAYGEIGSSADMFKKVSDILLSLLICNNINEFVLSKILEENIQ